MCIAHNPTKRHATYMEKRSSGGLTGLVLCDAKGVV